MQPNGKTKITQPPARGGGAGARLFALLALAGGGFLLVRNGETWLRSLLLYLSHAGWARSLVTGFPPAWLVARRFVAGESVDEAIDATRQLHARGLLATMADLGESVS